MLSYHVVSINNIFYFSKKDFIKETIMLILKAVIPKFIIIFFFIFSCCISWSACEICNGDFDGQDPLKCWEPKTFGDAFVSYDSNTDTVGLYSQGGAINELTSSSISLTQDIAGIDNISSCEAVFHINVTKSLGDNDYVRVGWFQPGDTNSSEYTRDLDMTNGFVIIKVTCKSNRYKQLGIAVKSFDTQVVMIKSIHVVQPEVPTEIPTPSPTPFPTPGPTDDVALLEGEFPLIGSSGEMIFGFGDYTRGIYSPDGQQIWTNGMGFAAIWDIETGKAIWHSSHIAGSEIFSPDGKYILDCENNEVKLWDVEANAVIHVLKHPDYAYSAVFSPNGKIILTICRDEKARLWSFETGKEIYTLDHPDFVRNAKFFPDGLRVLTACSDLTAKVWDVETGSLVQELKGHISEIISMAISPDQRYVLAGAYSRTAVMWNVETGKIVHRFQHADAGVNSNGTPQDAVSAVKFSPDGRQVLTGSADKTARLWNVATGKEIHLFPSISYVSYVDFSPDGRFILTETSDTSTTLWNRETGQPIDQFNHGDKIPLDTAFFSPDSQHLMTEGDGILKHWRISDHTILLSLGLSYAFSDSTFSHDGTMFGAGCSDGSVRVWDTVTGEEIHMFGGHEEQVDSIAFSPDSQFLLSGSYDNTARLWDLTTGKQIHVIEHSGSPVFFSPDGQQALTGNYHAKLWDVESGEISHVFEGEFARSYSPGGQEVLTQGDSFVANLWDAITGNLIQTFVQLDYDSITSLLFSPDGNYVLMGAFHGYGKLFDTVSGELKYKLKFHIAPSLEMMDFSPDGQYILAIGKYGEAILWNVADGKEFHRFGSSVDFLFYSSNGQQVFTGNTDGYITIWNTETWEEERTLKCGSGGGGFTVESYFSPDGRRDLLLTKHSKYIGIWPLSDTPIQDWQFH